MTIKACNDWYCTWLLIHYLCCFAICDQSLSSHWNWFPQETEWKIFIARSNFWYVFCFINHDILKMVFWPLILFSTICICLTNDKSHLKIVLQGQPVTPLRNFSIPEFCLLFVSKFSWSHRLQNLYERCRCSEHPSLILHFPIIQKTKLLIPITTLSRVLYNTISHSTFDIFMFYKFQQYLSIFPSKILRPVS